MTPFISFTTILCNFESVSPPEFFNQFYSSWQSDKTRPQPVIVDVQYNFKMRYKNHLRHIMFISRARAIQLSRGSNGIVNLMLKSSPRNEKWCGEGGIPDGPPFLFSEASHKISLLWCRLHNSRCVLKTQLLSKGSQCVITVLSWVVHGNLNGPWT